MKVELSAEERRLVERLYDERPARRAEIDACLDRAIAARARGERGDVVHELLRARLVDADDVERLRGEPRRRESRRKAPRRGSGSRPSLPTPPPPPERDEPDIETKKFTPRELEEKLFRADQSETGRIEPRDLRRRRAAPIGVAVLGMLALGSALAWRIAGRTPGAHPEIPPAIPEAPDGREKPGEPANLATEPGDEDPGPASEPPPLVDAAPVGSAGAALADEDLEAFRRRARACEERGDTLAALAVYRDLDPPTRARFADEEARLERLDAYRREVDAALDELDRLRGKGEPGAALRERLERLRSDPRAKSAAGRRLQQRFLELASVGDALDEPRATRAPPPAPARPATPAARDRVARGARRVQFVESRIEKERAERAAELAQEGARAREASSRTPLRVELGSLVLEDAVVVEYSASGFTLEAKKPAATHVALRWEQVKPELAYAVRRLAVRERARDHLLLGRFCVENHLFDEARRAFQKVRDLDPKTGAALPDLDALERAAKVFHGRFSRTAADEVAVRWDFDRESHAEDLDDPDRAQVRSSRLDVTGKGTFLAAFKEVAFESKLDVDATIAGTRAANVALGVRLEPHGARAAEYLAVLRRDRGDVVLYERRPSGTRELDRREGAAPGATKLGLSVARGQVRVRVDGRALLRGAAEPGWGRASIVVGGIAKKNQTGLVGFDDVEVRGRVRSEWLRKSFEEVEALLRGALAGLDDLPVFDRPDADPPELPLSLDEPIADRTASAEYHAGRAKLRSTAALDLARAADSFARVIDRAPELAAPRYLRALALERLGKARAAVAEVQGALLREPDFPEALALEARGLAQLGETTAALDAAEHAIKLWPDLALARAARAYARFHSGDLEKALADLDVALALDPWDDEVRGFRRNVRHVLAGPPWERRYTRQTAHFVVETDISQRKCDLYADHLEAIRAHFVRLFPAKAPPSNGPRKRDRVLVFDTAEGFHRYAELTTDDRVESLLGYYHARYGQLLLYEDKDDASGDETLRVLYHESFHQFAHSVVPELPFWVNEGLAEYFSTCRVDPARGVATNEGAMLPHRLLDLRNFVVAGGGPVGFARLMNETPREFYQGPVAQKYAQAWSMVHFLKHGAEGRYRASLDEYVDLLAKGKTQREAFRLTFGKLELERVESEWLRYVEARWR